MPPTIDRRCFLAALPAPLLLAATYAPGGVVLIEAPTNLGLSPPRAGHEPGAWRAPGALSRAGLAAAVGARKVRAVDRPAYRFDAEPGTRIRNGHAIRAFSARVGLEVEEVLRTGGFPLVIGGDCSTLLGALLGARNTGAVGLVHVDGHSDFSHPGNYDAAKRLGSVAGMDLALATGRGERLLALWNGAPLVEDRFVVQIGERDRLVPGEDYGDILNTAIRQFPIRKVLKDGIPKTLRAALAPVEGTRRPLWLHVDLDVLDRRVMPAVDSPGRPGLDYAELSALIAVLVDTGRVIGADVTIFDPELDADGRYARGIVSCLGRGFRAGQVPR